MSSPLDFNLLPSDHQNLTWDELSALLNPGLFKPSLQPMPAIEQRSGVIQFPVKEERSWNIPGLPWCSFDGATPLATLPGLPTSSSSGGVDAALGLRPSGILFGNASNSIPSYPSAQVDPLLRNTWERDPSAILDESTRILFNYNHPFRSSQSVAGPTAVQGDTVGGWKSVQELPSYLNLPSNCRTESDPSTGDPSQTVGFRFHTPHSASSCQHAHVPSAPAELPLYNEASVPDQPRTRNSHKRSCEAADSADSEESTDSTESVFTENDSESSFDSSEYTPSPKGLKTGVCRWMVGGTICGAPLDDTDGCVSKHIYKHSGLKVNGSKRKVAGKARPTVRCGWEGCKSGLMLPTSLARHIKTHLKFLDEKCEGCGMIFTRRSSRSRHPCLGMTLRTTKHSSARDKRAKQIWV